MNSAPARSGTRCGSTPTTPARAPIAWWQRTGRPSRALPAASLARRRLDQDEIDTLIAG
jgi:hypothetical protein